MPRIDVPPKQWGRSGWSFLIACAYSLGTNPTAEDQAAFSTFFKQLVVVLPCTSCRINFSKSPAPDVSSGDALLTWLYRVYQSHHTGVSRDEFLARYTDDFKSASGLWVAVLLGALLVGGALYYIYFRSKPHSLLVQNGV
jgi:hypothetical protein